MDREAKLDDQVVIDFLGKIDGEEFEGNSAQDFKLILGSKSMIPGFEDNIVGKKPSKFSIDCVFPEDYFKKDISELLPNYYNGKIVYWNKIGEEKKNSLVDLC